MKFSQLLYYSKFFKETYGDESGEFVFGCWSLTLLSPSSDQQQFSPDNIHTLSRDKVMRINKMIIIEKIP